MSSKNFAKGYLDSKESLLLLFDSGATSSLISGSCVQRSPFLSRQRQFDIAPRRFKIGNGEYLLTDKAISLEVTVQGHRFRIYACIVPNLTGPDVLLGDSTLSALNGSLDFRTHTFTVRPKKIWLTPLHDHVVKPGQTKHVLVKGKFPRVLKNSEILLQATSSVRRYCPSHMIVKLRKGTCSIPITNTSKKSFVLSSHKAIAFTDLDKLLHACQLVPMDSVTPESLQSHISRDECESEVQFQNLQNYPHLEPSDPVSKKTPKQILEESINLDSEYCILDHRGKERLREMLLKHKNAFSLYGEIGHCSDIEIDIQLKDETPFYIRPYPIAEIRKPVMDRELNKLVKLGILKKGCSPYSSPCLLLKKPNSNDYRFVSDLRYLNSRIVTAQQNYLSLQNVLARLGRSGCRVLSVIDLKSAFHALPLSAKSQPYTGICPYAGSPMYTYRRLPMGMSLSPARWQQQINEILSTIPDKDTFCLAIHDDVIIFSRTESLHMQHLERVLTVFEQHGLKLSPQKCRLFRRRCTYIGHDICISEPDGIIQVRAMSTKCDAIRKMTKPSNPKEVRRFIGAVTFLSMYLPKLQSLLKPLHALTRKNCDFIWTEEHDDSYEKIRQALVSPPVLCAPQGTGDFHLYSDTSRTCTGSILMQDIAGQQRVIGYYSKILPSAALRYSVSELELTGLFINITAWKYYLQSQVFHAYVDHSALVQIYKSKHQPPTLRLQKLCERLSQYCFDISFCRGQDMVVSDFLSRAPRDDDGELERILPIALPAQFEEIAPADQALPARAAKVERPVTRAFAKRNKLSIPSLFPGRARKQPNPDPTPDNQDVQQEAAPDVDQLPDNGVDNPPPAVVHPPQPVEDPLPPVVNPPPPPVLLTPIPELTPQPAPRRPMPKPRKPPPEEPRLVDKVLRKSASEKDDLSDAECPEFLRKPKPLVTSIDNLTTKHIPNQTELNRVLKIIKKKIIRDYNLPFEAQQFRQAQQSSPHFKPIYDFLSHNILPSDKKAARVIRLRAEQYLLCNNLLFRIFFPPNSDHFCFQLVIPEEFIDPLISTYHDSLLSNHQGCVRTYLTMRKLFYFHSMFHRIVSYVRSCTKCQEFKGKNDNLRPFHERTPLTYCPFQTISLDFKSMVKSKAGYCWLMVTTCAITRYTVCSPLKTLDAPAICEALIKVFCSFGIPEVLVTDAQSSLIGKVMEILCEALKISQKVISVMNHGSLHVERQIRSIADLIKVNLDQYGEDWVRYYSVAQYSFNTFCSAQLGNFSPWYLMFYREPRDISGLNFRPLLGLTSTQAEYIEQLKERFKGVSKFILELQENQQKIQNEKISQKLSKNPTYQKGQLVYLHKPSSSSLTSNCKKFTAKYVGPFVIHQVLDPTHVLLVDLHGRLLRDVFSVNRIKPAFMRATECKNISNLQKLREVLAMNDKGQESTDNGEEQCNLASASHDTDSSSSSSACKFDFVDETGQILDCTDDSDLVFSAQTTPVDLSPHKQNLEVNNGFAAPMQLSKDCQIRLVKKLQNAPAGDATYSVLKLKWQAGQLRVLLSVPLKDTEFTFWWDPHSEQSCPDIVEKMLAESQKGKLRCTGSPDKFAKTVYGMLTLKEGYSKRSV